MPQAGEAPTVASKLPLPALAVAPAPVSAGRAEPGARLAIAQSHAPSAGPASPPALTPAPPLTNRPVAGGESQPPAVLKGQAFAPTGPFDRTAGTAPMPRDGDTVSSAEGLPGLFSPVAPQGVDLPPLGGVPSVVPRFATPLPRVASPFDAPPPEAPTLPQDAAPKPARGGRDAADAAALSAWVGGDSPTDTTVPDETVPGDSLASAERMQALLAFAQQDSAPVRTESGSASLSVMPPPAEVRVLRAEPAPAPTVMVREALVAETGVAAAEASDSAGWPAQHPHNDGLQVDVRFDGTGRALVVVRTDSDALGQSLRDNTEQLQEAMDDFGLRVEVEVRQGDHPAGFGFSHRGWSSSEPRAIQIHGSSSSSPVPAPVDRRARVDGLSLSVYA